MSTPAMKTGALAVQEEYTRQLLWQAEHPVNVLTHAGWTLSAAEAQYLVRVTEHILCSFICKQCGYYGADWVESCKSYHFRCPFCGLFYKPWSARDFNKLVVIQHPATRSLMHLPTLWPGTAEDNWLMSQCELYARRVDVPSNLDGFLAKQTIGLATLIDQAGSPTYFDDMVMSQSAKDRCQPPEFPPVTYEKHTISFRGARWLAPSDPATPVRVFKDWDKLVALLGNMLAGKKVFEEHQLANL